MKGELWAWHDYERDNYSMVYNRRFLVEMCSPDYFKKETELGRGKIVKLKVVEVGETESDKLLGGFAEGITSDEMV